MKKNIIFLFSALCVVLACLFTNACKDTLYEVDDSFYNGKKITVKNPLVNDTLFIEQFATDLLMIQEVSDSTIAFDSRSFIYKVEHDSILAIDEEGNLNPVSPGITRVDIVFRSNASLNLSIIVKVWKDYHSVEKIQVPGFVKNILIEKDYTTEIGSAILVWPGHADNKKLHFSYTDAASSSYATLTDEGVITGLSTGIVNIIVVSDDNPAVTAEFQMEVVNEILVTSVNVHAKLNNLTIGLGENIDLNAVTSVTPASVNENNRKLSYTLVDGANVVSLDEETGRISAIGEGTATLRATSKYGLYNEFVLNVNPALKDLTRSLWSVATHTGTGYTHVTDGTTGKPEDMFDGLATTFLSLVKPGKAYSPIPTQPADVIPYFDVDLKGLQTFKSLVWQHRSANTYAYLRAWGIDLDGSLDGINWVNIATDLRIPTVGIVPPDALNVNQADPNVYHINLSAEQTYRYVRVKLTKWSDNSGGAKSGSTMQIAEFGLGKE